MRPTLEAGQNATMKGSGGKRMDSPCLADPLVSAMAVKSIQEINDRFKYVDDATGGKNDGKLVACGQQGGYNELSYIYTTYLKPLVAARKITEQEALDALDKACDMKPPRNRSDYYAKLESLLGVKIK